MSSIPTPYANGYYTGDVVKMQDERISVITGFFTKVIIQHLGIRGLMHFKILSISDFLLEQPKVQSAVISLILILFW